VLRANQTRDSGRAGRVRPGLDRKLRLRFSDTPRRVNAHDIADGFDHIGQRQEPRRTGQISDKLHFGCIARIEPREWVVLPKISIPAEKHDARDAQCVRKMSRGAVDSDKEVCATDDFSGLKNRQTVDQIDCFGTKGRRFA